jgi:arsenite methyltransferase
MSDRQDATAPSAVMTAASAVRQRYSAAAAAAEPALCCPVDYDAKWLEVIPDEVLERDYGCGDPSKWVQPGDTVLDLGSGGGKICFIAAQVVGPQGRVIGVDCTDDMLALARRHQPTVAKRIGYDNITFRKGRIQDLKLDLEQLEEHLAAAPVSSSSDWLRALDEADRLRKTSPMVPDGSVDVVVSNCVLNLVDESDRRQLFTEVHRVLKRGGRVVISDIVCDEEVPQHLKDDPKLWSGCLSGAFREDAFLQAFEEAGFYGIEIVARQSEPWAVIEGIEFRSLTVRAWKGKEGPCLDRNQAVIYHGPWKSVTDDDGHTLYRGRRMAVCDKTFQIYTTGPYANQITPVPPAVDVPLDDAPEYNCRANATRPASDTKRGKGELTILPADECCGATGCC